MAVKFGLLMVPHKPENDMMGEPVRTDSSHHESLKFQWEFPVIPSSVEDGVVCWGEVGGRLSWPVALSV